MRKKKPALLTLGFETKKKSSSRSSVGSLQVRGTAWAKPNPEQVPLMLPKSEWVRPEQLPDLHGVDELALDTETRDNGLAGDRGPGWAFKDGYVAGVGVAWRTGSEIQRIYVPVQHPDTDNFPKENVARWVTDITRKKRTVFFNAGYDIGWLHADMGVPIPPVIHDASCAAFMVDENREDLSLDGVCAWRGVVGKDMTRLHEVAGLHGVAPNKAVANIWRFPARYAAEYGAQDPVSTLLLMEDLRQEMNEQGLLAAYSTEMRLIPLMHAMRKRGIRIDVDRAVRFQEAMHERVERALAGLSDHLKMRVGLNDVRSHLWRQKTFDMERVPYRQIGGKAKFERDWMRQATHWLPRLCAEATQCADMAEKFVGTYLLEFAHNGRIHASVNQWLYESDEGSRGKSGTRSHRLSYANPPLQQAPSRGEMFDGWPLTEENAKEFRACFLPEEGELWFSPDYKEQEYKHIVADAEKMGLEKADVAAQMYRDDPKTSFHTLVAGLTGLARYYAKQANFAKVYGAGVPKFAFMINKTVDEASGIMTTYDEEMPFVKQLNDRCQSAADRRGYIRMFDGARSHFNTWEVAWLSKEERARGYAEGHRMNDCPLEEARERQKIAGHPWAGQRLKRAHTRKAMNRRIQGNAARQMKLAMAQCWDEGIVPLLQMHDELSFSLPASPSGQRQGERVSDIMREAYVCSVPFLVDAEWGSTWGDAKHPFGDALATAGRAKPKPKGARKPAPAGAR